MGENVAAPKRSSNDRFLESIILERNTDVNCICEGSGLVGSSKVTSLMSNKRRVIKENLCAWLKSMCQMLNNNTLPLLQKFIDVRC